jgi:hypothetical protein
MTDYSIGGIGYAIVEVDGRYEEKTGFKGVDGKELIADTRYEPLKFVKTFGKVVQIPFAMGERPIRQIPVGFPGYGPQRGQSIQDAHAALYAIGGVYKWQKLSDIQQEVKIGDTIWFNRTVLNNPANLIEEYKDEDGSKFIFKVDYDLIICVDNGEEDPTMIGGWCLLEPKYEEFRVMPTFTDLTDKEGNKIPKPKSEWLVFGVTPKIEKFIARLKYFGTPLKGDELELENDLKVFIRPRSQHFTYKFKGMDYILLHYWEIQAAILTE